MITHNLGFPRIGKLRELKKAEENYWAGKISVEELQGTARRLRSEHRQWQKEAGLDLIPVNDFSLYDQILDLTVAVGAIPERFHGFIENENPSPTDLYFALARGYQKDGYDLTAMEMTKWFDTNYHYIVPEFSADQSFSLHSEKIIREFTEARDDGIDTKPVIPGPVSFLLLGKEKEEGFHRLDLIDRLLPVYLELLKELQDHGATYIQLDEPCLVLDGSDKERAVYADVYTRIREAFPDLHLILVTYFDGLNRNLETTVGLPVNTIHIDLVRAPEQLDRILTSDFRNGDKNLSLGIVDGRNIWKNDFSKSLILIEKATTALGADRIWLAPSCSLLHVPYDLALETDEEALPAEVKNWLAFARQKLDEIVTLAALASDQPDKKALDALKANKQALKDRENSGRIHLPEVKERVRNLTEKDEQRGHGFSERKSKQQERLRLPAFPTTTIGSLPQTREIRRWRSQWKKGRLSHTDYDQRIKNEIKEAIEWQEEIGLDVPVHGEFERNDMVEYFGEQLEGFVFTKYGWVQSYGSRCVKPPVIVGDIRRKNPLTLYYTKYAQTLTSKPVKGMLTGPVTILQWSFVRDDQPRRDTCTQIALAIRDEVTDLEKAGIQIIQIDEPALREGLPLKREEWREYLEWAVRAFRVASSGVRDETQIHTHMCYSEFNDIIESIARLDADVITIETSRSQMELLDAFADFEYPNDIGPGVYDIHSPRIPSKSEIKHLLVKASEVIPGEQLWVNPDCGLKTRKWPETKAALQNMIEAALELRGNGTIG